MSQLNQAYQGRRQPKLLDQVRYAIRAKHYSLRTEEAYVQWIRRFILFHNKCHPKDMGVEEVRSACRIWPFTTMWPPPPKIRPCVPFCSSTSMCSGRRSGGLIDTFNIYYEA